ncbi:MAG: MarR family winged helix-turn-helix transcriptional regulator [Geminicoccaceae bacterium]
MIQAIKDTHERALDGIRRLEAELSFRFAIMQRLLDRQMTRLLERHGLTLAAYRVLVTIQAFGEIAAADLVRLVVVDKGLVSRCCRDLAASGLITSRPDPRSARRKLLRLSEAGEEKMASLEPDVDARNAGIGDQLDAVERAALDRALSKITRHVAEDLGQDITLRAAVGLAERGGSEEKDNGPLSA